MRKAAEAMTIRRLTAEDVSVYREIRLEALRCSPTAFGSSAEEVEFQPVAFFQRRLEENDFFGAFAEDRHIVGVIGIARETRRKRAHQVSIVSLHVSEKSRRQGIGGALLDHAIEAARRMEGVVAIRLSVTRQNEAAMQLYASRGFLSYGVEPDALSVGGRYFDEALMRLPLTASLRGSD